MNLRATNLNLLPILRALLRERSITRAAVQLGLSQPAASNALARLRAVFGDPLLVPIGRTMRLTPRGEGLRLEVDKVCDAIELLLADRPFDAALADRRFVVATPDYMASLLGPPITNRLTAEAPGMSARFVDVTPDFRQRLLIGDIDIAIIGKSDNFIRGFEILDGYSDRMVGVVAADHPLAASPPQTSKILRAYPPIGFDLGLQGIPMPNDFPVHLGEGRSAPQITASHLRVLPLIIAQTTGVAIMPEAFARQAATLLKIAYFNLPNPLPPLDLCMIWSPVLDSDPAHGWFRSELDAAMQRLFHRRSASA